MKLGISIAYWPLTLDTDAQRRSLLAAEELGFDSVWSGEAYWSDGVSPLAWATAQTERIGIGSAIFQIPGRTPAATAMAAATLDRLSGGRFTLGLGVSGPAVSEGWHGVRFDRQLARTRDYVAVVRNALARERLAYEGDTYTLPLPGGPGKPLKLGLAPVQERVPILLAALGPKNTALTGEIADGWLPIFYAPEFAAELRAPLDEGIAKAGREAAEVAIYPQINAFIADDVDAARDKMRETLALYVGGMGPRENNFYAKLVGRYGFSAEAERVQDHFLAGEKEAAEAALPDELIDMVCLCGPEELVAERLRAFEATDPHTLILLPTATDADGMVEQLTRIAAARRLTRE